jgi:carbon starvation protein
MLFVATTTSTAAYREITGTFWRIIQGAPPEIPPDPVRGWLNIGLTVLVLSCVLVILVSAVSRWLSPVPQKELAEAVEGGP